MSENLTSFNLDNVTLDDFDSTDSTNSLDLNKSKINNVTLEQFDSAPVVRNSVKPVVSEALKTDPNQYAEKVKVGREVGVSASSIDDVKAYKTKIDLDKIDFDKLDLDSPGVSKFLQSFDNATLAQADIKPLTNIEKTLKRRNVRSDSDTVIKAERMPDGQIMFGFDEKTTFENVMNPVRALGEFVSGLGAGTKNIIPSFKTAGGGLLMGSGGDTLTEDEFNAIKAGDLSVDSFTDEYGSRARLFKMGIGPVQYETDDSGVVTPKLDFRNENNPQLFQTYDDYLVNAIGETNARMRKYGQEVRQKAQEAIAANTPENLTTAESFGSKITSSIGPTVAGLAASIATRNPSYGVGVIGSVGYGEAYGRGLENGLNQDQAADYALLQASAEVVGAKIPLQKMMNPSGNWFKAVRDSAMTEALEEGLTSALQSGIDAGTITPDMTLDDALSRLAEDMLIGGMSGALITGTTQPVIEASKNLFGRKETLTKVTTVEDETVKQGQQFESDQSTIDQIAADVENMQLKKLDKETLKQAMNDIDGDNNTQIFIDGLQTSLYLQTKTPQEIQNDETLQLLSDSVKEAAILGGDLNIPLADFAADVVGSVHYKALREFMTIDEKGVSPFRQEQEQQITTKFIDDLITQGESNVSQYVEAQDIYDTVRDQLVDTGRVSPQNAALMSRLVPAWATVQAQTRGISVKQVYEESGLNITGPQTGKMEALSAEVLRQAKEQGYEGDNQLEAKEWTSAVAKGLDMSKEARMQRAKDMGFDTDQVYYHGTRRNFDEFEINKPINAVGNKSGVYFTKDKNVAREYAEDEDGVFDDKSKIISVYLRNPEIINNSYSGEEFRIDDPKNIRSVNAAFDPEFKDSANLLAQSVQGDGVLGSKYKTGRAVSLYFTRNTEKAPAAPGGMDFGQSIEPAGEYMVVGESEFSVDDGDTKWVKGTIKFNNPIVLEHKSTSSKGWKKDLSDMFDGKTGKRLTDAIKKAGYDGILTVEPFRDGTELSEAVNLSGVKNSSDLLAQSVQGDGVSSSDVQSFAKNLESEMGLKSLNLFLTKSGVLKLDTIIVNKSEQGKGKGTESLTKIINYADQKGLRLSLTPAIKDDFAGTTSQARLKKFYKRFGFVENKGRNKDFTISDLMIREPKSDLLTQSDEKGARGYYDPQNSMIRLTESSDLSTFLHEFAHFVYDMELRNNGVHAESIDNWFARNADDVAKEANIYLRESVSDLKQSDTDQTKGFDTTTVYYHGTNSEFNDFDLSRSGENFVDALDTDAVFFTQKKSTVQSYGDVVKEVYIDKSNALTVDLPLIDERFEDENYSTRDFYNPVDVFDIRVAELIHEANLKNKDVIIVKGFKNDDLVVVLNKDKILSKNSLKQSDMPKGEQGIITADDVRQHLASRERIDSPKDNAIRIALHEQFARGFEAYVMEGKAPSIELRNAFAAFARWMVEIYKSIVGLNVKLDDEMRQVFDRMLATEEQIAAAEARNRVQPMFTDAAMAGMSEQEWVDYQKRQAKVKDKSTQTLRDKLIAEITRQTTDWWKAEKEDMIIEETERLRKEQVYRAREELKNGDMKLDLAATKEIAAETKTDKRGRVSVRLPAVLNGMAVSGGEGLQPDHAAIFFGYETGDQLINDLVTAPSLKDAAESAAQKRMLETHGDMLNDGTIEAAADEAVNNEERGKFLLHELKILRRGTQQPGITRDVIKKAAEDNIAQLSYVQIMPGKYRKAEINAAAEAAEAMAKGDREKAASAKARQVLNYYLGLAATDARNNIEKIQTNMRRYSKKKVRIEIAKVDDGSYMAQIDKILKRFEFRKISMKSVDTVNQSIKQWAEEQQNNNGAELNLSSAVADETYVNHWKKTPYNLLKGVSDTVKNIEHVARYINKIDLLGDKVDFQKVVSMAVDKMDAANPDDKRYEITFGSGEKVGRLPDRIQWAKSQMTKIPFLLSWLDGGKRVGFMHDLIMTPINNAVYDKAQLWKKIGKPIVDMIQNASSADRKRWNKKYTIPEIQSDRFKGSLSGNQILSVALNTGNDGNLRKLLLGYGWASADNPASISRDNPKLKAVLKHMTKSDWTLVQNIWDKMDELYPMLAETHRQTTGLVPPRVDATPFSNEHGEFRGGYYPLVYDPDHNLQVEEREKKLNEITESLMSITGQMQSSVNTGAVESRTEFIAPIKLDLNVVPNHLHDTIHYITHHAAVRQVNRLLRNESIQKTIRRKMGKYELDALKSWLNDVAKDGKDAQVKNVLETIFGSLRTGVTLGVMGFKASTGIIQLSGIFNTYGEVGARYTLAATRTVYGDRLNFVKSINDANEFALARSKMMIDRIKSYDREVANAVKVLKGHRGVLPRVQEASMKHIAFIQYYGADLISWHAGYMRELAKSGDESKAARYADWVVENVQGSGAMKDMASLYRNQNKVASTLTMFMTFFSSLWNMERDMVRMMKRSDVKLTDKITTTSAKLLYIFTLPVLFEMAMRDELTGDDDDDETFIQKFLTKTALFSVSSLPFLRDAASSLGTDYGYSFSPVASVIEKGLQAAKSIADSETEVTKSQVKSASQLAGIVFKVPGISQAWASGEHLYEVIEEGEDFSVHSLLFGPKKE